MDKQREREAGREKEKERETETDRDRERETDREGHRERDIERKIAHLRSSTLVFMAEHYSERRDVSIS